MSLGRSNAPCKRQRAIGNQPPPSAKLAFVMLTHLECTRCGDRYPADRPQSVCSKDAGVLYARYDLDKIKRTFSPARLAGRAPTMWRYDAVLPEADPVTL